MRIKNVSDKARWCGDTLLKAGEEKELKGEIYEIALNASPELFREIQKQNKINKGDK